ncbi:MAG: hypothetical protein JSV02_03715 [Dehalococcoidia bacterium]|nr:MAG: hypothetical protein JSV02_03715 [Dehalococcoidia bacterium]
MKKLTNLVLPVIILALTLAATGCNGDKEIDAVEGASPSQIGSVFEWISETAESGGYYNLAVVRSDEDLVNIYEAFANDTSAQEEFRDFGIDPSQIDHIVYQEMDSETAHLVLGRFDLEQIRESLNELGFTSVIYENTEFWEGNYTTYDGTGFAFMPDKLIWGHEEAVRSFVSTVEGQERSFYDIRETKEVLARFPDWPPIAVDITFDVLDDYGIRDAVIMATAMAKKDSGTMNVASIVKFIDAETADQMCEYLADMNDMRVTCDGEFAIIEGEETIEEYTQ